MTSETPSMPSRKVTIHIKSIKSLSNNRKQIKITENKTSLTSIKIGNQLFKVIKSLKRGRFIVEPA